MGLNLNLDSFRAMVGQSNYGDVRLGSSNSLEKVNNHFLQRTFGLFETKPSKEENYRIRMLFLDALTAAGMSKEMTEQIRKDLGLVKGGDYAKPLSRRTIAVVLEKFDADNLARQNGKDNPLVQRFGAMKFADFKRMVQKLNATPNEVFVSLPDDKLEVFFNRYGGLFRQELAKSTFTSQNPEELDLEIGRRVREYLKDSVDLTTLEAGGKAFTQGKDRVSESRQGALCDLEDILSKERDEAKRKAEEIRLYNECQSKMKDFEKSGIEKKYKNAKLVPILNDKGVEISQKAVLTDRNIAFTEDDFLTASPYEPHLAGAKADLTGKLNSMAQTIALNRNRNPMNVYFNKKVYTFKFAGMGDKEDLRMNANWNFDTAKAFLSDLQAFLTKEKGEKFSLEQFLSASLALGQGFVRIPQNVYSGSWTTADCSITLEGDKITANYTQQLQFTDPAETKNYGLSVDYNQDGTARPTSLKPVDTPIRDPTNQDGFSIFEPPQNLIPEPSNEPIQMPPEGSHEVRS